MAKHKGMCWTVSILVFIGALNWGLVGLGSFMKINLNIVNRLLGQWPQVEWVVYLLVGVAALLFGAYMLKYKDCACTKDDKKE